MIVFRDVPGVANIERQIVAYNANRLMSPEIDDLAAQLRSASQQLFGLTSWETGYLGVPEDARPPTQAEWEAHFKFLEGDYDEVEAQFWAAFGLDVTDGEGAPLECLQYFGRQMVCAVKRLHPSAALMFANDHQHSDQIEAAAEAWGRRLLGNDRRY